MRALPANEALRHAQAAGEAVWAARHAYPLSIPLPDNNPSLSAISQEYLNRIPQIGDDITPIYPLH